MRGERVVEGWPFVRGERVREGWPFVPSVAAARRPRSRGTSLAESPRARPPPLTSRTAPSAASSPAPRGASSPSRPPPARCASASARFFAATSSTDVAPSTPTARPSAPAAGLARDGLHGGVEREALEARAPRGAGEPEGHRDGRARLRAAVRDARDELGRERERRGHLERPVEPDAALERDAALPGVDAERLLEAREPVRDLERERQLLAEQVLPPSVTFPFAKGSFAASGPATEATRSFP